MTPRRLLTALITAATALVLAPTAHADTRHQPSPDADGFLISTSGRLQEGYVWDQTSHEDQKTLAWLYHGRQHQRWTLEGNSLKNIGTGWCATAVNGRIHGRSCNGSTAQQWSTSMGPGYSVTIVNMADRTCATHQGGYEQVLLKACDGSSVQFWYAGVGA